MPRIKIGQGSPDPKALDIEIARLRDLDVRDLRACWRTAFKSSSSPQLPRHILFRVLAYRLQATRLGDLDAESVRLLDHSVSPDDAGHRAVDRGRKSATIRPGTILGREWNGKMQRVAVLADGFSWEGMSYPSLSKVAFAITGTRWNGPKFFGLRDNTAKGAAS
jgi:hypothetical protein